MPSWSALTCRIMIVSVRWAPGTHSAAVAELPVVASSERRSVPITRMFIAPPAAPPARAGRLSTLSKTPSMRFTWPDR